MKFRICLLLGLLYSIGTCVYADAIMERRFPQKRSAIQSSTMKFKSTEHSSYNSELLTPAIKELKQRISANPNNYSLYVNLVDLYLNTKKYDEAFDELVFLNKLKNQNRLNSNTINELTTLYNTKKNNIRYERNKSLFYSNLAVLALITNNKTESLAYISKAAETGSNSETFSEAMSLIFETPEDYEQGISICDKVINKNPNASNIRKIKATLLKNSNLTEEAIKEYVNIVALNPKDNETKYTLYKLLKSKNLSEKDIISKLYAGRPIKPETAFYDIASILLENDDIEDAKYYATKLAQNEPNKAQGYMLLSEIYRKEGKLKESYDALSKVKDKVDNKEEVKNYNVQLAKLSNDPIKEAVELAKQELYEQAIETLKNADQNNLLVLKMNASFHYFGLGKKKEGFDYLNKAMTLYPNSPDIYTTFARFYIEDQDFETARKYVDEAKKIKNDGLIQVLYSLINKVEVETVYLPQIIKLIEEENYTEATRLIDDCLKKSDKIAQLYFYKAIVQISQSNYAASTASLYKCIELDENIYLAYYYLATSFENLGEKDNALLNYEKFLEKLPDDAYDESEKVNYAKNRIQKLQG